LTNVRYDPKVFSAVVWQPFFSGKAFPVTVDFSVGEQQAISSYLSMLPNDGGKHFGVVAGIRQSIRQHA
jgi:hypothetical protein